MSKFLAIVLVGSFLLAGCVRNKNNEINNDSLPKVRSAGASTRVSNIVERVINNNNTFSEADFKETLDFLKQKEIKPLDASMLLGILLAPNKLSKAQVDQVMRVIGPIVNGTYPGDTSGDVSARAIVFVEKFGDRSDLQVVERAKNDPREIVRMTAQATLDKRLK